MVFVGKSIPVSATEGKIDGLWIVILAPDYCKIKRFREDLTVVLESKKILLLDKIF